MANGNGRGGGGRPKGTPNPDGPERIRRQHNNLYDALLRAALSGNADAVRLCFEITGEHPPTHLALPPVAAAAHP